jgi:hypothetical protein
MMVAAHESARALEGQLRTQAWLDELRRRALAAGGGGAGGAGPPPALGRWALIKKHNT